MTLSEFRIAYPEFATASDELVTNKLTAVALRVSDSWGDEREEVIGLEVAHALAISPNGRMARLSDEKSKTSTYGNQLAALRLAHGALSDRAY